MDLIVGTWQTCTITIDWVMVHNFLDQDKILFKSECTIWKKVKKHHHKRSYGTLLKFISLGGYFND